MELNGIEIIKNKLNGIVESAVIKNFLLIWIIPSAIYIKLVTNIEKTPTWVKTTAWESVSSLNPEAKSFIMKGVK